MITDVKIIGELGNGMYANVYLCKSDEDQQQYALKVEKISSKNKKYDLTVQEWREIEFSQGFANNFPNHFVTLCDYDVKKEEDDDEGKGKQYLLNKKKYSRSTKQKFNKKNKSKYCIRRLYTLVDDTLKNVIDNLSCRQVYTTIVQVTYICFLMQIHEYTHNDLHLKNIGVIKTTAEYVNILDKKVKSYGIHIKALDFGIAFHKKYNLTSDELNAHKYGLVNDINRFVIRLVKFNSNDQIKKIISWNDEQKLFEEFLDSANYNLVKKYGINSYDRFYLFQILYPEKFQRMYLGKKYKQTYQPIPRCELEDILFIFKYKLDLKKIIKYFLKKCNDDEK